MPAPKKKLGLTLAESADALFKLDAQYQRKKREYEAKLAPLKEELAQAEAAMLDVMIELKQEAISTKTTTVAIRRTTFAELYDDQKFFEYVGREKAWELVRKQPVVTACRERWDDEIVIPGVRPGTKTELSITPRKRA